MKSMCQKWRFVAAVSCLFWFGNPILAFAGEEHIPGPDDRFQQLERRIRELAERQEQILHRLGAMQERQGQGPTRTPGPRPENMRAPAPQPASPAPMLPAGAPPTIPEKRSHPLRDLIPLVILAGIISNILLAIWIFTDIRKRAEGSGIFVALALVAGIPAAIIYSLVRIGDRVPLVGKPGI